MDQTAEYKIKCKKGYNLYCRCWNADHEDKNTGKKALVFIVHGFAEHCLYYTEIAEELVKLGFHVFSHDHVGHGQSECDRAHVNDFSEYVQDILFHIDQVKGNYTDLPVFLIGHSMGGAIAVLCSLARPNFFKGTILIAPLILPDRKAVTPFKIAVAKVMAKVTPQLHVGKLDASAVSRDPAHVKKYTEDPLVYHNGVKCRWGVAMLDAIKQIQVQMEKVDWPFLILHGEKDALCDIEGSKLLYETAPSKDKELKVFPDAFHQLHHELDPVKKETFDLIINWLNNRA